MVEISPQENDRRQILDIEVNVVRKVVPFQRCQCPACRKTFRAPVDPSVKENVSYGPDIKTNMLLDIIYNDIEFRKNLPAYQ